MKLNHNSIFFFIVICSSYAFGQTEFDLMLDNPFRNHKTPVVSSGDLISVVIENHNPFLYKTTVEAVDQISFNKDPIALFTNKLVNISLPTVGVGNADLSTAYQKFKADVRKYQEYTELYQKILRLVYTDGLAFDSINKKKDSLITSTLPGRENLIIDDIRFQIKMLSESYLKVKEAFNKIPTPEQEDKNTEAFTKEIYAKLETAKYESFGDEFSRLLGSINKVKFTFVSSPIVADKDEFSYKIKIEPIENDDTKRYGAGNKKFDFRFPVEVINRFKIDFSTGLFMTYLADEKFVAIKDSVQKDTISYTKGYRVVKNDDGKIKVGVMALAHFYYKFSTIINVGVNLGIGVIQDQTVSYMFGGSLMFGKKQRFVLNVGTALGSVARLSSLIKQDGFYLDIPLSNNLTVKKWEAKFYAGISYNLTE